MINLSFHDLFIMAQFIFSFAESLMILIGLNAEQDRYRIF